MSIEKYTVSYNYSAKQHNVKAFLIFYRSKTRRRTMTDTI